MKIAIAIFKYFPYGGLERECMQLVQMLLNYNLKVFFYTSSYNGQLPEHKNFSLNIIDIFSKSNHKKVLEFSLKFNDKIKHAHYDLIIGFNKISNLDVYYAGDSCYANRKVYTLLNFSSRRRTYKKLEASVFNKNNKTKILYLSDSEKKIYQNIYSAEDNRFYKIHPLTTFDRLNYNFNDKNLIREKIRDELNIPENDKIALMICSKFITKGVDRSIDAIKKINKKFNIKIHLIIIGNDSSYKKQNNLNKNLIFLGSKENIYEYMLASDVLLHPARTENAGIVILEAIIMGLPIITTEICGYAEHVAKANAGIILPAPFNKNIFKQKIYASLINYDLLYKWSKNAIQYAEKNKLKENKNEYVIELVNQFIDNKKEEILKEKNKLLANNILNIARSITQNNKLQYDTKFAIMDLLDKSNIRVKLNKEVFKENLLDCNIRISTLVNKQIFELQTLLRKIQNKRYIYKAKSFDTEYIVKIFFTIKNALLEYANNNKLKQLNITTPELLHIGSDSSEKIFFIVYNYADGDSVYELMEKVDFELQKNIFIKLCIATALLHKKQTIQTDNHLNNYLVNSSSEIIFLDSKSIQIHNKDNYKIKKYLKNFALLLAQLKIQHLPYISEYINIYLNEFNEFTTKNKNKIYKYLKTCYIERLRKINKKLLIRHDDWQRISNKSKLIMLEKKYRTSEIEKILFNIEKYFDNNQNKYLEINDRCAIKKIEENNLKLSIKKYSNRNLFLWMKNLLFSNQARKSWKFSHIFQLYGFNTVKPIALIEEKRMFVTTKSYFIYEYEDSMHLSQTKDSDKSKYKEDIIVILSQMHGLSIVKDKHEQSDFLIKQNSKFIYINNLDSIKYLRTKLLLKKKAAKNLMQLLKNQFN